MMTHETFLEHVRSALYHLYEPDRIRENPLAGVFGVANRIDTFAALQRILTQAIEALEPAGGQPAESMAWEIYEPLYYRYVHQMTQEQVAKQLGMSVRHLRRKEHAALEVLAARLWEQFDLDTEMRGTEEGRSQGGIARTVSEELAWLRDAPPERPVDLGVVLRDVLRLTETHALRHQVRLDVSLEDTLPSLAVHEIALKQLILNLLGVTIHRSLDGMASVSVVQLPAHIEIRMEGTSSDLVPQSIVGDDAANLELAHQLAELCGGKLTVLDRRRVFAATLRLPTMEHVPVLVIDDSADTLQLLQRYTVGTPYQLFVTRDSRRALSLAEQCSPAAIVLDVMMPGVDGWKVLAQIRQHPHTAHIPVVVCTILPQEEMASSLGASGFVRKPVSRQTFLATLDRQLTGKAKEPR
jgi:CheY-like chemotaxis protein